MAPSARRDNRGGCKLVRELGICLELETSFGVNQISPKLVNLKNTKMQETAPHGLPNAVVYKEQPVPHRIVVLLDFLLISFYRNRINHARCFASEYHRRRRLLRGTGELIHRPLHV